MGILRSASNAVKSVFRKRPDVYFVKFDAYWARYIPYAFLYLGAELRKAGLSYKILHNTDQRKAEQELQSFAEEVIEARPLWVGLSVITGRSTYYAAKFSKIIKDNSDLPVVWGGIHPTILTEQCLEQSYIDYVILGEAEGKVVEFTQCLLDGKDPDRIAGIGFKRDGELLITPSRNKVEVDQVTIDWDQDVTRYISKGGLSYITSRGCPYRCDFCVNVALDNRKWRPFPEQRVLDDIAYLKRKYRIEYIHFNDDNFFVDQDRAFRILNHSNLRWFAESRIDYFSKEFARRVKAVGRCDRLMAGGESGSSRILKGIHKGHTKEQMMIAARLIGRYKIPSSWSFIVGMPNETHEDIRKTFLFTKRLEEIAEFRFCKPGLYLPYPSTRLYMEAVKRGFEAPKTPEGWALFERYTDDRRPSSEECLQLPWLRGKRVNLAIRKGCEGKYDEAIALLS